MMAPFPYNLMQPQAQTPARDPPEEPPGERPTSAPYEPKRRFKRKAKRNGRRPRDNLCPDRVKKFSKYPRQQLDTMLATHQENLKNFDKLYSHLEEGKKNAKLTYV